jgi:thiamine-phosphate pyrophosphorylase
VTDFGFYLVITNPVVGYAKCAEAAVRAGVKIIQLRMKHAARDEILREAREMRRVTAGAETLFIVNDDPSIAAEAEADGVHVGQDDLPPAEVRARYPSLKIVGLSTHNPAQVAASRAQPIDYIGVGPVYATPTKDIPDPTLGLETMRAMIASAAHPAVAIGGIDATRLADVLAAGARNWAVVRAVCQSPDPYAAICNLQAIAAEKA